MTASGSKPDIQTTWEKTLAIHKGRFAPEDLAEIEKTTKPDDLLDFIKNLDIKNGKGKFPWLFKQIEKLGVYFNTYEHSLDMITQGLPSPGCLVWGSIKFVLSVSASAIPNAYDLECLGSC